jgi:pimeloyl-ACP methyl ester carboxylesterase
VHQINFFEKGAGFPIVCLHGFCESNMIWIGLSEQLADQFRIICPDLPGFGKSKAPENGFSLKEIGTTIVRWLQGQDIQQCIIVGHSLGGYIALEILREHQGFASAITLLNSSAFEDSVDKKENRNKLIDFIGKNGVSPFLKTFVPSLFYPPTINKHAALIAKIMDDGKSIEPGSVMNYAAAMRDREDSTTLLKDHPERVSLIAGDHDQNVPLEKSRLMATYLLNDHTHILPDSAHMCLFEQSGQTYDAIRSFATKIRANQ